MTTLETQIGARPKELTAEYTTEKVDETLKRILEDEAEQIRIHGKISNPQSIREIATQIEEKIIKPYAHTIGNPSLELRRIFLRRLEEVEQFQRPSDPDFSKLDKATTGLLFPRYDKEKKLIDLRLRDSYGILRGGCYDIHFQRQNGVSPSRPDIGPDYTPGSLILARLATA